QLIAREAQLGARRRTLESLQTALRARQLQPESAPGGAGPHPAAQRCHLDGRAEVDLQRNKGAFGRDRAREKEVPGAIDEMDMLAEMPRAVDLVTEPQRHPGPPRLKR